MQSSAQGSTDYFGLCDCMWDSFDPRERTICGIATVTGGRGAVAYSIRTVKWKNAIEKVKL